MAFQVVIFGGVGTCYRWAGSPRRIGSQRLLTESGTAGTPSRITRISLHSKGLAQKGAGEGFIGHGLEAGVAGSI